MIKTFGRNRLLLMTALALLLVLAVGSTPALAKKDKAIEVYDANALMQQGGRASMVKIQIYRWSSDDEREQILDAIKTATKEKLPKRAVAMALRGQDRAGYINRAGQMGYPLRYAKEFNKDGVRTIILATDRPVGTREAIVTTRKSDFDVTVVVLTVDEEGNGEGVVSIGTEVKWDEEKGMIDVTNISSQPVKLTGVRKVK